MRSGRVESQERTGVRSADPEGAVAELGPLRRASAAAVTALSTAPGEGRPPCALTHRSCACSALSQYHGIALASVMSDPDCITAKLRQNGDKHLPQPAVLDVAGCEEAAVRARLRGAPGVGLQAADEAAAGPAGLRVGPRDRPVHALRQLIQQEVGAVDHNVRQQAPDDPCSSRRISLQYQSSWQHSRAVPHYSCLMHTCCLTQQNAMRCRRIDGFCDTQRGRC